MGKHRYRSRAETSIRSFRRSTTGQTEPGSAILVVTEGENTEPAYLEWIRDRFAAPTVELVAYGAGRGDPRALADEALRQRKERRKEMRKKKLAITRLEDFDAIWIVFDTDVLEPDKLHNGIAYAASQGIKIAHSTPCFEFWLLLHKAFTTAPMAKCKHVIPHLKKELGWLTYSRDGKKASEVKALIAPLVERRLLVQAVANSRKVREHHYGAKTLFPANPSTEMDRLIRAINEAVSAANKFLF